MKKCSKCKTEFDLSCFNKKGKGLQSYCKKCQKQTADDHYRKHQQAYVEKSHYYKLYLQNIVQSYKNRACADCEKSYPHYVMEFAYLKPGTQSFNIDSYHAREGKTKLLKEILKCEVVCANCNRVRKHKLRR